MPHLFIITPVFKGMPYLRECVESVLSQDFPLWTLLYIDQWGCRYCPDLFGGQELLIRTMKQ